MIAIVICDEFEEILCYVSTEMGTILRGIVDDGWSCIRESAKSLGESKWVCVGIEISTIGEESSYLVREDI